MIAPVVPTYLAALAPEGFDFKLVDMLVGDEVDYDEPCDLVGIAVRTPLADSAYQIADEFIQRDVPVVLGGPHVTAFPLEANQHATAVVVGESFYLKTGTGLTVSSPPGVAPSGASSALSCF